MSGLATVDILSLLAAVGLAALGGESFLKGVLGVAAHLRLPKLLVATTLAAFATSSPELTVSSLSAIAGKPEIGLGDALGSNVVNIALILGLALLFGQLPASLAESRRDFALAVCVPLLTLGMVWDGTLSRTEGAVLLGLFIAWLAATVRQAVLYRRTNNGAAEGSVTAVQAWLFLIAGLVALILAGRLFVNGASNVAAALGVHAYVIGALVVAVGTSLPELVTTLFARLRGHDEVGLGTLLGSNLFNGLAIVGTAASIHPIHPPFAEVATALGFGVLTVVLMLPLKGRIARLQGVLLLAAYVAFVTVTLRV